MKVSTAGVSLLEAEPQPKPEESPVVTGPKMPDYIDHPLKKGELVSLSDVDQMADMLNEIDVMMETLTTAKTLARISIGQMCADQTTKTRYVAGKRRMLKVEMPDRKFDNSKLKEAWNAYSSTPEMVKLRDEYLKIESVKVSLTPFKKLEKTSVKDNKPLETIKRMIVDAEQPATANPTVKVE